MSAWNHCLFEMGLCQWQWMVSVLHVTEIALVWALRTNWLWKEDYTRGKHEEHDYSRRLNESSVGYKGLSSKEQRCIKHEMQFLWKGVPNNLGRFLLLFSCSVMSDSFATPWTVAHQAPLSMTFPRQEYWSGLPLPTPADLSDPGTEPVSPASLLHCSRILHPRATKGSRFRKINYCLPFSQSKS